MSAETDLTVLDLFSAAAGGWSLGMHRAGFRTVAAAEKEAWRRALYAENNPGVILYDDVCSVTADRLYADLGTLPWGVFGSPPCQDISSANTKGQGVDGERSVLFFEAIRIAREIRTLARELGIPGARWLGLENSSNLRNRGSDRVIAALEEAGYAGEPCVVGAGDDFRTGGRKTAGVGANHERSRAWLLYFDPAQLADAAGFGRSSGTGDQQGERSDVDGRVAHHGPGDGTSSDVANADIPRLALRESERGDLGETPGETPERDASASNGAHADKGSQSDGAVDDEMGGCSGVGGDAAEPWSEWNGGLAHHLRVDDGLSAWVAGARVAVGGPRGTAAASLIVEAFGDAVIPQIPEAIGRAILRTEAALAAIYAQAAA